MSLKIIDCNPQGCRKTYLGRNCNFMHNDERNKVGHNKILNSTFKFKVDHLKILEENILKTNLENYLEQIKKTTQKTNKQKIVLGTDNAASSYWIVRRIAAFISRRGFDIIITSPKLSTPSPLIASTIKQKKLAGGINIVCQNRNKKKNMLLFFNSDGSLLRKEEEDEINYRLEKTQNIRIKETNKKISKIDYETVNKYIKNIFINSKNIHKEDCNVKVVLSTYHASKNRVEIKALEKAGINFQVTENHKWRKLNRSGSYRNGIKTARKHKSEILFVQNSDCSQVGVAVKYKMRWKFIKPSNLAALYIDYMLNDKKLKKTQDSYIIKTRSTSGLIEKICQKHKIATIEVDDLRFINDEVEKCKNFLLGVDDRYSFIFKNNCHRDGIQTMMSVINMAHWLKLQNKCLFTRLQELQDEHNIFRNTSFIKSISDRESKRIFRNFKRIKCIGKTKVVKAIDLKSKNRYLNKMMKLILEDGSWIIARHWKHRQKIEFRCQTIGQSSQEKIKAIIQEKEIKNWIEDMLEVYPDKKLTWKTLIKYFFLFTAMALTLYFVFQVIYSTRVTGGQTYKVAKIIFTGNYRVIFVFWFVGMFLPGAIGSIQKIRILKSQGEHVRLRHMMISVIMGYFFTWITPFAIGGDGMAYWYLRRKGFRRGPLGSTFVTCTIFYQISLIFVSVILFPLEYNLLIDQLQNGGVEIRIIIWLFITGAFWNLFATSMILLLVFNKRWQDFIVRTIVTFVEWMPWISIYDPVKFGGNYQHVFFDLRQAMRNVWKKKLLMIECFSYQLIISFVSITLFSTIFLNEIRSNLIYGSYFTQVIAADIVRTANSYSLTPGGSGTGEFISIWINSVLYKSVNGQTSRTTTAGLDLIMKLVAQWPFVILSLTTVILIALGERRKEKYKIINKNNKLNGINIIAKTTFYKKAIWIYLILLICYFWIIFGVFR